MEKLEEKLEERMLHKADYYAEKYSDYVALLESSPLNKFHHYNEYDIYALGEQLQRFEDYKKFCEDNGIVNELGTLPQIALDVIAASYATSIIPMIASVQPLEDEKGLVYYKAVKAATARGSVSAGDTLWDAKTGRAQAFTYAAEMVSGEAYATTAAGTTTYAHTCDQHPVRPRTVKIYCNDLGYEAVDDGEGNIIGTGFTGTINYDTGACSITFSSDPGGAYAVYIDYGFNFESSDATLPTIQTPLTSTDVVARIWALRGEFGFFKAYAMRKRFGLVAEDELAKDLTAEVNAETTEAVLNLLYVNATGNTDWSKTGPSGVSYAEHKLSFKDALATAESVMYDNAGRGTISYIAAGSGACAVIAGMPGFVRGPKVDAVGPHLYGTLDGIPVIRTYSYPSLELVVAYKGVGAFETAVVWAPYMPLVITTAIPADNNPFRNQRAAAVWAGSKCVVPQFVTKVTITT